MADILIDCKYGHANSTYIFFFIS